MRAWIVLLLLLLVPLALASQEAEDLFGSEVVGIDVQVASDLKLTPKHAGELDVDYVQADLYFFPKEDVAQRVLSLVTTPEAKRSDSVLRYRWEAPLTRTLRFEAQSAVEVRNFFPRVLKKIPFPITSVPPEARAYLAPSEHIDSTSPSIVNLANKLAQGKDDLFVVVSEIAIWTKKNIVYNLSTLTADVSQKASWVLEHKNGVCDELTSLFIAMLRALGVPARFVTGISYTASPLFPDRWGAHGWAEVYFPDVGWVPFDPTFGEFGWVDPGHIKMMTSLDPEEASTRFEWRGTNAQLEFTEPDIDASITKVGKRLPPVVDLSIKPLYDEIGFGSYNLIQATVENLQQYYLTTEIRLARVNELETLEPLDQQVILKPREQKALFWRVRVASGLQERFIYTIPTAIYTVQNDSVQASFKARTQGSDHTKVEVTRVMNTLAEEEERVVSKDLALDCSADKETLYPEDVVQIACTLQNKGTVPQKALRVCIEEQQCTVIDLGIGQTRTLSFTQAFTKPGAATVFVRASNQDVSKSALLAFVMNDIPAVEITELVYPKTVSYGQPFSLVFSLKPVSHSTPKNVRVTVKTGVGSKVFEMPELPGEQAFEVELHANDLSLGTTDIEIEARYQDGKGGSHRSATTIAITQTGVPWYVKPWLWFRGLFE